MYTVCVCVCVELYSAGLHPGFWVGGGGEIGQMKNVVGAKVSIFIVEIKICQIPGGPS